MIFRIGHSIKMLHFLSATLPMPPNAVDTVDLGQQKSITGRSKLLNMPMPPTGSPTDEDNGGFAKAIGKGGGSKSFTAAGGPRRKPRVIGKAPPPKMTEDGTDWGERCIDIYEIVDRVSYLFIVSTNGL
jgi:hypothetical protein